MLIPGACVGIRTSETVRLSTHQAVTAGGRLMPSCADTRAYSPQCRFADVLNTVEKLAEELAWPADY